ncbi:MAG: hypothetical protein R6V29_05765 [Spirochaetia bacterium]
MTMRGELVFVDTNVLLSATNSASGNHETRPVTGNGLGMEHNNARTIITTNTEDSSAIDELHVLSPEQAIRIFAQSH